MKLLKFVWLFAFFATLLWSGVKPKDYFTWVLEVLPAVIGVVVLAVTYQSFRLTNLLYGLILCHSVILMVGGHYTYAEVPFFDGLFGAERNNYDKLGHFFQGFMPAILIREILVRKEVVNGRHWLAVIVVSICLAFSALYELLEWGVAIATGENADAFLGTQGYQWDTQTDMAWALIGAIAAWLLFSKLHDSQLRKLSNEN